MARHRLRRGVYPGSFNPPTVAHLAVAQAAVAQHDLDRLDLAISRTPLAKETVQRPRFGDRIEVMEALCRNHRWLQVVTTDHQLLADIAHGYDVLVVGADKWAQIHEHHWYADEAARRRSLDALPTVAIAPRPPHPAPPELALPLPPEFGEVSSTDVRMGRHEWMTPEAAAFDAVSGAWSDPERYEQWLAQQC